MFVHLLSKVTDAFLHNLPEQIILLKSLYRIALLLLRHPGPRTQQIEKILLRQLLTIERCNVTKEAQRPYADGKDGATEARLLETFFEIFEGQQVGGHVGVGVEGVHVSAQNRVQVGEAEGPLGANVQEVLQVAVDGSVAHHLHVNEAQVQWLLRLRVHAHHDVVHPAITVAKSAQVSEIIYLITNFIFPFILHEKLKPNKKG